jgi:hypothetical protein
MVLSERVRARLLVDNSIFLTDGPKDKEIRLPTRVLKVKVLLLFKCASVNHCASNKKDCTTGERSTILTPLSDNVALSDEEETERDESVGRVSVWSVPLLLTSVSTLPARDAFVTETRSGSCRATMAAST